MKKLFVTIRKFSVTLKAKIATFRVNYINKRIAKLIAAREKSLMPTVKFAVSLIPAFRSNPPKEKRLKTLCTKCYRYFFFEPSLEMLNGKNIAYTNCTHCNQELVSFASPELETAKEAVSWLKSEHKEKMKVFDGFVLSISTQLGIDLSDKKNEKGNLELLYKQLFDKNNTGGLLN